MSPQCLSGSARQMGCLASLDRVLYVTVTVLTLLFGNSIVKAETLNNTQGEKSNSLDGDGELNLPKPKDDSPPATKKQGGRNQPNIAFGAEYIHSVITEPAKEGSWGMNFEVNALLLLGFSGGGLLTFKAGYAFRDAIHFNFGFGLSGSTRHRLELGLDIINIYIIPTPKGVGVFYRPVAVFGYRYVPEKGMFFQILAHGGMVASTSFGGSVQALFGGSIALGIGN